MTTPLLLLIFNRPKETEILIKRLSIFKPKKIYVFSDGPRTHSLTDNINCRKSKSIIEKISWKCEIKKNYQKKNLGLKKAISKGISWFFQNEKRGLILEDDCIPNRDFFEFCTWGLKKFNNDSKVGSITGNNFLNNQVKIKNSYYFSKYAHCWGWATWRNRWELYDKNIKFWNKWRKSKNFESIFNSKLEKKYWIKIFDNVKENNINSWAYPWNLCLWYHKKIVLTPKFNLVSNIGISKDATHTYFKNDNVSYQVKKLKKPYIKHTSMQINDMADNYVFKNHLKGQNYLWPYRLLYIINLFIHNPQFLIMKISKFLTTG